MNVNGQFWKPLQYMDFWAVISGIPDKKEAGTKVPACQKTTVLCSIHLPDGKETDISPLYVHYKSFP